MRVLILLFCCSVFFSGLRVASAASMLERSTSSFYLRSQRSNLFQIGLGSLCTVMTGSVQDVPCNPALLVNSEESVGAVNLMLSENAETITRNRDLLKEDGKYAFAESLLSERDPIQFEGSLMLWWRSSSFAVSLEPLRATYYSRVRNQAFPDVAVQALQEQSLQIQWAGFTSRRWSLGFSLKALERKMVQEEFNLFEALPHLDDYFKVKSQRALFLEPGVSYLFDEDHLQEWQPRFTALVSQLGYVDNHFDEVPTSPYVDTGLSISPEVFGGEWEWALNYRWISKPDLERKFRLGTQYHIGPMMFLAAYDRDEWDLGVRAEIKSLSLGYVYKKQNWVDFDGRNNDEGLSYFEARLIF